MSRKLTYWPCWIHCLNFQYYAKLRDGQISYKDIKNYTHTLDHKSHCYELHLQHIHCSVADGRLVSLFKMPYYMETRMALTWISFIACLLSRRSGWQGG
jgi:hypothetical protein